MSLITRMKTFHKHNQLYTFAVINILVKTHVTSVTVFFTAGKIFLFCEEANFELLSKHLLILIY